MTVAPYLQIYATSISLDLTASECHTDDSWGGLKKVFSNAWVVAP